jgi:hypothetical protein
MPSLEAGVRPRRKWLRLTVQGGTTCELEQMARLSLVKGRIRPAVLVTLTTLLERSFRADAPRVVDLESVVPDDCFIDMPHIDDRGGAILTRMLIEALVGDSPSDGGRPASRDIHAYSLPSRATPRTCVNVAGACCTLVPAQGS